MRLKRDVYDATVYLKSSPKDKLVYNGIRVHVYVGDCLEFRSIEGNVSIVPVERIASVRLIRRKRGA